jgi:starch synthase
MVKLNIVFLASEAIPLAKTGGLADVAGSLPAALHRFGHRLTVIMPYYKPHTDNSGIPIRATDTTFDIWADGRSFTCRLHEAISQGVRYLLIEQDTLFARKGLYTEADVDYPDNLLRFMLFTRAALEAAARLPAPVDILHCHDWQAGMAPLLLKSQYQHYPGIAAARTVYTIHNLAYQGLFDPDWMGRLGIPDNHFNMEGFEYFGQINCMKAAIEMADAVTTVSPGYAREIMTPEFGCGLDGYLTHHQEKISGIVNGLDTEAWNSATDRQLAARFSVGRVVGKRTCKAALQREFGLNESADTPLLSVVSRLADQKGIDLITECAPAWLQRGWQLAILGSGDPKLETSLQQLAKTHPRNIGFTNGFDEGLARRIYAGGDIFLMPSRFEPCGIGQMIAMRYGNVPVVRATGGLRDTVIDYDASRSKATGIHFTLPTAEALDRAVRRAVDLYSQPRIWSRLIGNGMRRNASWEASSAAYEKLYLELLTP